MKLTGPALYVLLFCLSASAGFSQKAQPTQRDRAIDSLLQDFLGSNLPAAAEAADRRVDRVPKDAIALFVRMETAELQDRPEVVLDSALRLCALAAAPELQEVASNRVLQHAANSWAFNSVLRRVKSAATIHNGCTFNLRLALVAAASDGAKIDLDMAALSSGLLTQWSIAGPFGRYNNVDFDRHWTPESERSFRGRYSSPNNSGILSERRGTAGAKPGSPRTIVPERFWFRDGMIALPEYFPSSGIVYAASEVDLPAATSSQLDVLSSGTYEVFVDGKSALLHDARYAAAPTRDSSPLSMAAGHHRILLKFSPDAAPLSVALHSQFEAPSKKKIALPSALEAYTQALAAYFRGDLAAMATLLRAGAIRDTWNGKYLHALLYSAAEEHSPRADAAWKAVATAQPGALLARLKSDQNAVDRRQPEVVYEDVMSILAERPQSEMALQLAFNLSRRNQVDGPVLLTRLLESHPSCARLADAVKFYNAAAQQDRSSEVEQKMASCAPESLQYARLLAESGRHSAAAAYLQQLVARNPLHRAGRRMLVEQLLLDNQISAAKLQARELREIAASTRDYVPVTKEAGVAPDSRSERGEGFASGAEFYVPYRRDGIEMVRKSAQRNFSGESVILLSDKVVRIRRNGPVSVYVHRIIRPLNKEGINRYGEVTLPRGADLLELRTIKANGEIIEPELAQQKPTISMPALEAGDAIDEEYVLHYAELEQMPESAGAHTFGSFAAPLLHARMVLLCPAESTISVREQAGPPLPLVGENNGTVIRIWERDNIAQTVPESFLPAVNLLPTVTVGSAEKTSAGLRDQLIDASRAGLHVNEAAAEFNLPQVGGDFEKAKRLYRFVTSKIDSTGPDWSASPAEDTLDNGQGSRTMALLALARAVGLHAELLLARKIEQDCGEELSCYTEPLVRFWLQNRESVDVDAESDDLPFGTIPPSLDTREAHLIPLLPNGEKKAEIVALNPRLADEKSVAEGDLSFSDGDLVANMHVQLGSMRAQEVRNLLRSAGERDRQAFFEQLAMRIFPGAASITGIVANENDPEQPLKLSVRCMVPQFINRQNGAAEINQLAPALGLATLYAKTPTRKFPLLIDSLFFESTVFHLRLPDGMEVHSLPAGFTEKTEFGEYALRFVRMPRQVDIHRDFRIPVQVIQPDKYGAFANFALRIAEAERQRISLESRKDAASIRSATTHKN